MNILKLKRITLLSLKEKQGKRVNFCDNHNIILGENDTGKSSLLKSIFYTFGAETYLHPGWKSLNPISIVDFEFKSDLYTILRNKNRLIVFDKKQNILNFSESITNDFSPFFSDFFNFHIQLRSQDNQMQQATPAFCLMPFYIDQDRSWINNWSSFLNLSQFRNWRNDVVDFHSGSRPSQYYIIKSKKDGLKEEQKLIEEEKKIHTSIYDESLKEFENIDLDISLDVFKKEITSLLDRLNHLKRNTFSLKENLKDLYNERYVFEEQILITEKSLEEISSDYNFCVKKIGETVECPTCGKVYENSFTERFSIAKDEDRCLDLLQDLRFKVKKVNDKIIKTKDNLLSENESTQNIEKILETKKKQIKLKDLIDYNGKQNLLELLENKIKNLEGKIKNILFEIKKINDELNIIDSPKKRQKTEQEYVSYMNNNLELLNVYTLSLESYKSINSTIKESGSDLPRALLAYYYSVLYVMHKNQDTGTFFPIIIDAPKQQEQDTKNYKTILKFIRDKTPKNIQLILGVVDLADINFDGDIIKLKDKYHLMNESDYPICVDYFKNLYCKLDNYFEDK